MGKQVDSSFFYDFVYFSEVKVSYGGNALWHFEILNYIFLLIFIYIFQKLN